ncbi:type III polyketide synthase, partial [Gemmatimonadota bacterium]
MSLRLTGIGTAVPKHSIEQNDAARVWASYAGVEGKRAKTVKALYRRSGVAKRHSTLFEGAGNPSGPRQTFFEPARFENDPGPSTESRMRRFESDAPPLAAEAAELALRNAGVVATDLTHL